MKMFFLYFFSFIYNVCIAIQSTDTTDLTLYKIIIIRYQAELLNTTREEQIVKKQQILEELQKVETELHEKARAQLMLNVEQKQRSQQQQLLQQQVCTWPPRKY